jgi:hypothetical protein
MLRPNPAFLAQTFADNHPDLVSSCRIILDVVGAIGVVLIVILIIAALPMIPDFIRYLRLKNM